MKDKRLFAIGSKVWTYDGQRGIVMDVRVCEFVFRTSRIEYDEYLVAWRTDTYRTGFRRDSVWADRYDGHMQWIDGDMISQSHANLHRHEEEPDYNEEYR